MSLQNIVFDDTYQDIFNEMYDESADNFIKQLMKNFDKKAHTIVDSNNYICFICDVECIRRYKAKHEQSISHKTNYMQIKSALIKIINKIPASTNSK